MINGLTYDYESIKLMLPTGLVLGAESVEYGDEKDDQVITGSNSLPLGIGRGEYKGTCKLELQRFEYDKLNLLAAVSGGFFNLPPISVNVAYGDNGQVPVMESMFVHFTKRDFKGAKGDQNLTVSVEGVITAPIVSNGVPGFAPFL
ncbi:MAG: hypothetical protein MdMp014T_1876 [Treponematales bacterium]